MKYFKLDLTKEVHIYTWKTTEMQSPSVTGKTSVKYQSVKQHLPEARFLECYYNMCRKTEKSVLCLISLPGFHITEQHIAHCIKSHSQESCLALFNSANLKCTGLVKKFIMFFPYDGSNSAQWSLTSFKTILLDCIVTAVISTCIKEELIKISEFLCIHFNIENGKQYTTLQYIMLYYFKKGKNATKMQKQRFVQCREKGL